MALRSLRAALLVGFALTLTPLRPAAAATIKTVARQGGNAPNGFVFSRFREPVIGDAVGTRVSLYSRRKGGGRCIFALDPNGGRAPALACSRSVSPVPPRQYVRLSDPSINALNQAAWSSTLTYGFN